MSPNRGCARRGGACRVVGLGDLELLSSTARPHRPAAAAGAAHYHLVRNSIRAGAIGLFISSYAARVGRSIANASRRVRRQAGLGVPPVRAGNGAAGRRGGALPVQAAYPGHVWSWDFILDRTTDGRPVKMLTVVDEYTRQCLVIHPARSIPSDQVLDTLQALVEAWGAPAFMRSDNGSEFIARLIQGLVRCRRHPDALYRAG